MVEGRQDLRCVEGRVQGHLGGGRSAIRHWLVSGSMDALRPLSYQYGPKLEQCVGDLVKPSVPCMLPTCIEYRSIFSIVPKRHSHSVALCDAKLLQTASQGIRVSVERTVREPNLLVVYDHPVAPALVSSRFCRKGE